LGPLVPIGDQPDLRSLRRIDEYIKLAPPEARAETLLNSLAAYMESAASTGLEKVRAVYMWITGNITLDSSETKDATVSCEMPSPRSSAVPEQRMNSTSLRTACLRIFGVASKQITGFAKDFGYSPLKALTVDTRVNHDWLAVRVDGKWGFMTACWAPASFSDSASSETRGPTFIFCLLPRPSQAAEACYRLGVQLRSHSSALIDSSGQMKLRFWAARTSLSHFGAAFFNVETGERCRSSLGGRCAGLALWRSRRPWCSPLGPVDKEPFPDFDGFYGARSLTRTFSASRKNSAPATASGIEVDGGECAACASLPTTHSLCGSPRPWTSKSSSCSVEMDYLMLTVRIRMSRAGFYRLTLNCKDIYSVSSAYTASSPTSLFAAKNRYRALVAFPRLWHHRHLVKLVSHMEESIQVDTEAVLKFKGTGKPLKQFIARFVHPRTGQRVSAQHIAAVLDYRRNEATVTARPPTSGTFWELQVFASTDDEASASDVIVLSPPIRSWPARPPPSVRSRLQRLLRPLQQSSKVRLLRQLRRVAGVLVENCQSASSSCACRRWDGPSDGSAEAGAEGPDGAAALCTVESNSRLLSIRTRILGGFFLRLTLSCAEADEPSSFARWPTSWSSAQQPSSSKPQPGRQRARLKVVAAERHGLGVAYDDWALELLSVESALSAATLSQLKLLWAAAPSSIDGALRAARLLRVRGGSGGRGAVRESRPNSPSSQSFLEVKHSDQSSNLQNLFASGEAPPISCGTVDRILRAGRLWQQLRSGIIDFEAGPRAAHGCPNEIRLIDCLGYQCAHCRLPTARPPPHADRE
uniref:TGc domain-containing protein n=1 Tax=Macrostomum lignano TaxID=282301 RepID=A0A1I8FBW7_9PLAT